MNRIGILCATTKEIAPYLSDMKDKKTDDYAMHAFHSGLIEGVEIVVVHTGCGKINASIAAQAMIDKYDVDAVIFSGIAGGMKEDIQVFDTVVCTESTFHDTDNDIYTDYPIMSEPVFHADECLITIAHRTASRVNRKIHFGLATTGDRFTDSIPADALCIDMETAAAAHACYLNSTPFIAIRSISDNNKEYGQEAIDRNHGKAAYQSYCFVREMLVDINGTKEM